MHFQLAVVVDEAQLPEFIHERAHPRSRCANHFRERLLADLCNDRLRSTLLAEVCQEQKRPRQALFARVEQLIDEVGFNPDIPSQKVRYEHLGKRRLLMEYTNDGSLLQPHGLAFRHRRDGRHTQRLPCQASFAKEFASSKDRDDRFFSLLGNDGYFYPALLDVENRVGGFALRKDDLTVLVFRYGPADIYSGQEHIGLEGGVYLALFHCRSLEQGSADDRKFSSIRSWKP